MSYSQNIPYVVLLGDVGAGKSTIVEKVTGVKGRSSDAKKSFTLTSEVYESLDGKLIICDTPGSNAMDDKFQHNLNIAHALNFMAVRCILVVVKADTRMDNVIEDVKKYAEVFLPEELPIELLSVCITHMDQVQWTENEFKICLDQQLGIKTAIFSSKGTSGTTLSQAIRADCATRDAPMPLNIDSDLFLKLFKIGNSHVKVMQHCRREIARFKKMKAQFYNQRAAHSDTDQMNMTFEFQAWVFNEIAVAQKDLTEKQKFKLVQGSDLENEAGHIANLTNQLRKLLSDIRTEAARYHQKYEKSGFRACPKCGEVWTKIEGCDLGTICGSRPTDEKIDDQRRGEMSTFRFEWDAAAEKLNIGKLGARQHQRKVIDRSGYGAGCGAFIEWRNMKPVNVNLETSADSSSTNDVPSLPPPAVAPWEQTFKTAMDGLAELKVVKVQK